MLSFFDGNAVVVVFGLCVLQVIDLLGQLVLQAVVLHPNVAISLAPPVPLSLTSLFHA